MSYAEDQESMCERFDRRLNRLESQYLDLMNERLDSIQADLSIIMDVMTALGELQKTFAEGGLPALMRMR